MKLGALMTENLDLGFIKKSQF